MLLGRSWIHDHRCVPSSWYQCIKDAPIMTDQIRVRGLKNPFAIEEAHFHEAIYFIEKNILTLARQNEYSPYPAIIDLPSHVKPTANYPPKLPPKKLKTRNSSASSIPERSQALDGSLLPFKVVLHAGRPSPYAYPPVTYAKNEQERNKIIEEDRVKAHSEMGVINFKKEVIKFPRNPRNPQEGLIGRSPSLQGPVQTGPGDLFHPGTNQPGVFQPGANQPGAIQHVPRISCKIGREILTLARRPTPNENKNRQSYVGVVIPEPLSYEKLEATSDEEDLSRL